MILVNGNKVSQVICLKCLRRWIAGRPTETMLDDLECPSCGSQGFAIETGETCVAEELIKQASQSP